MVFSSPDRSAASAAAAFVLYPSARAWCRFAAIAVVRPWTTVASPHACHLVLALVSRTRQRRRFWVPSPPRFGRHCRLVVPSAPRILRVVVPALGASSAVSSLATCRRRVCSLDVRAAPLLSLAAAAALALSRRLRPSGRSLPPSVFCSPSAGPALPGRCFPPAAPGRFPVPTRDPGVARASRCVDLAARPRPVAPSAGSSGLFLSASRASSQPCWHRVRVLFDLVAVLLLPPASTLQASAPRTVESSVPSFSPRPSAPGAPFTLGPLRVPSGVPFSSASAACGSALRWASRALRPIVSARPCRSPREVGVLGGGCRAASWSLRVSPLPFSIDPDRGLCLPFPRTLPCRRLRALRLVARPGPADHRALSGAGRFLSSPVLAAAGLAGLRVAV